MKTKYNVVHWMGSGRGEGGRERRKKRTLGKILENVNQRWSWVNNVSVLILFKLLFMNKYTILM